MPTTTKPKVDITPTVKRQLLNQAEEESQVVVHCSYTGSIWDDHIRIWESTFLCPSNTSRRSKLVFAENIVMFPQWMSVKPGQTIVFTLVFKGLPKDCLQFDLLEDIPESDGFFIENIARNATDVYHLELN